MYEIWSCNTLLADGYSELPQAGTAWQPPPLPGGWDMGGHTLWWLLSRRPTEPKAEKGEEVFSLTHTCQPQSDCLSTWPCPLHRWSQAALWVAVIILLTPHLVPSQRARGRNIPFPCPVLRSTYILGGNNTCSQSLHRRAIWLSPLCPELWMTVGLW